MPPLFPGTLIKRVKRFLADIRLADGQQITAHCPNSGSMLSCNDPGCPVLVSCSDRPGRHYPFTWEMVRVNGVWVGINTMIPNRLIYETLVARRLDFFTDYTSVRREVAWGEHSRIDLLLSGGAKECYIEVKNVTLAQARIAYFPDAVTERGQKHLRDLQEIVRQGHRGVILFLVQREDVDLFKPASFIDMEYSLLLSQALNNGVEILVCQAKVAPEEIIVARTLPFQVNKGVPVTKTD